MDATTPPTYDEQVDLVASAWYMYLILIFVYLVAGIISYGFRQYFLACKNKAPSITSVDEDDEWVGKEENEQDLEQLGSFRNILRKRKISNTTENSITPSMPLIRKKRRPQEAPGDSSTSDSAQQLASLDIGADYSSENSSVQHLVSRANNTKLVYPMDRLLAYDRTKQTSLLVLDKLTIGTMLRYSVDLPPYESTSAYITNRAIIETRKSLVEQTTDDPVTISLDMLHLVWIGNRGPHANPNYFLHSFSEIIEDLMEHRRLAKIISKTPIPSLKVLMLEMIIIYCFDHWTHVNVEKKPVVHQTRFRVFMIMCTLKLQMSACQGLSAQEKSNIEVKYLMAAGEMIKATKCYEYIDLIPMMVETMRLGVDRWLFLDMFQKLVQHHGDCCMAEYFADANDVDYIIEMGLADTQRVVQKTIELHTFLDSKCFTPASRKLHELRPITPGGWRR